jgi:hypothetical protein
MTPSVHMDTHEADSVLEILAADGSAEWRLEPDVQVEYPIVIRNQTLENHEVEISILDAVDWAVVRPERLSLRSGKEVTTRVVLAKGRDAHAPAGHHKLTLELADFEGTKLGQLAASVMILPYYQLQMMLRVRGPLLRRGAAEGFVLHCTVVNQGNVECTVRPEGEPDASIVLSAPSVRVPFGGDVSFDIEAWWATNPLQSYPTAIRAHAEYPGGQVTAEIPWADVVAQLGPIIPPLAEAEEFPDVLRLSPEPQLDQAEMEEPTPTVAVAGPARVAPAPPTPIVVEIAPPRAMKYTYGRRINPWWPPAERFGGRWRVKPLPIAAFAIVAALFAIARLDMSQVNNPSLPSPRILISTVFRPRAKPAVVGGRIVRSRTSAHAPVPAVHHHANPTARYHHATPKRPVTTPVGTSATEQRAVPYPETVAAQHVKGVVWQGDVTHVSADNIKVIDAAGDVRSFIVSQNFKSVFTADGASALPMSAVHPGTTVRVFYSYIFGLRHPNAIFVLSESRQTR